jgi:subtilase family serine protease
MDRQNIFASSFVGTIAFLSIVYAIYQYVILMLNKDKISYTNATVIDTTTAVPEAVKVINSRLANVSLSVNGK